MTPAELRALMAAWPSVPTFARDLGIGRTTIYRYLDGSRDIPEPTARLIRLLHAHPGLRDECRPRS